MKPGLSLIFIFDSPQSISDYSFFDIGSNADYINDSQTMSEFKKWYYDLGKEQLTEICELCNKDLQPISIYLSGLFIELLEKVDADMIQKIKSAVVKKHLHFMGGTYSHSLSSIYSTASFTFEIESHRRLLKKSFGASPVNFFNTENIYAQEIARTIQAAGYKSTFAGKIDWYLGDKTSDRIFNAGLDNPFSVLVIDADQGKSIFQNPEQEHHFLQLNSEDTHHLGNPKNIVNKALAKVELKSIEKQIETCQETNPYKVHSPVIGSYQARDLNHYNSGPLQSQVIKRYYRQISTAKNRGNKIILNQLLTLSQGELFYSLSQNYKGAFERYNSLMNILSDIEIKLAV